MTIKNILKLIACIALPLAIGGISGYLTMGGVHGWYAVAAKPSFNPPDYVFAPVWTFLYILMGISFYMVITSPEGKGKSIPVLIFSVQLVLNFLWSAIFFWLHRPLFAFMELSFLWLWILLMIVIFYRIRPMAALLQIPYLLWVAFAGVLNYAIWSLNK